MACVVHGVRHRSTPVGASMIVSASDCRSTPVAWYSPPYMPPTRPYPSPNQYIFNDAESWGTVEDPISTLLRRAAFYVVEHPSPATRAEIATARARDCRAKVRGYVTI